MEKMIDSRFKTKTGWLCLDFVNTVDWHASTQPEETLSTYADLVLWVERMAIVSSGTAEELIRLSKENQAKAEEILNKARELREAIYRIFVHRTHAEEIDANDLSVLNMAIARMMPNQRLSVDNGNFIWDWTISAEQLESILWPVVWSAAELLNSEALERVGQCADDKCGWFFWDNSRNRSRRWCDMRDCGNRAKSRRHYKRAHEHLE
jgi:predicted RNA-binding Zn ribbon-like protein